MVLDTLKKSLNTFTDKVTSPVETITAATISMKKSVLGPEANILALVERSLAAQQKTKAQKRTTTKTKTNKESSTGTYDQKKEVKAFHHVWKKHINTLIDHEYALSKEQKKLAYTTQALQKQSRILQSIEAEKRKGSVDKDLVRRSNTAKQQVDVFTKKDIPAHIRAIKKLMNTIAKDEQTILQDRKTYRTGYEAYLKQTHASYTKAQQATKTIVSKETRARTTLKKRLDTTIAQIRNTHASIANMLKKSGLGAKHTLLQTTIKKEDALAASLQETAITMYEHYLVQMNAHQQEISLSEYLLDTYITSETTLRGLEKERTIQLKILLGNKKRHSDTANTIWHGLVEANNTLKTSITGLVKQAKEQATFFKKQTIAYEKEIGARTTTLREQAKHIKQLFMGHRANQETAERCTAVYASSVVNAYTTILTKVQETTLEHLNLLKKSQKSIEREMKEVEKEQQFFNKRDKLSSSEKKKLHDTATKSHNGELIKDIISHHIVVEQEHVDDRERLLKAYKKQLTWEQKKRVFYKKGALKAYGKCSKYPLCKQIVRSPKKIAGVTL